MQTDKPNFIIVENNNETEYNTFIAMYNDPKYTVKEIKRKLDISSTKYYRLVKDFKNKNNIKTKSMKKKTKPSYVYNNINHSFRIAKYINGKSYYFGSYSSRESAELAVKLFKKNGWDVSKRDEVKKYVLQREDGGNFEFV